MNLALALNWAYALWKNNYNTWLPSGIFYCEMTYMSPFACLFCNKAPLISIFEKRHLQSTFSDSKNQTPTSQHLQSSFPSWGHCLFSFPGISTLAVNLSDRASRTFRLQNTYEEMTFMPGWYQIIESLKWVHEFNFFNIKILCMDIWWKAFSFLSRGGTVSKVIHHCSKDHKQISII